MEGADVLLADGTGVHIRPIRPDDAEALAALHARFSERTRYLRYFTPYPRLPQRDLDRFVHVDHHDREALVVLHANQLIGIGQYERLGPTATDAEVAFAVEDAYQGRGVGSVLLEHLAAGAQHAGIVRFVAEVLPRNGAMLRVFTDAGYLVDRSYADGVVQLTFAIAPTERSRQVQYEREHRTEARSIARLLMPSSIAVYGARHDGTGVGAAVLDQLISAGYTGTIYPIHPTEPEVRGLPAYPSAASAPGLVDLVVVAVPAAASLAVASDAAMAGAHALVVISAGFAETGQDEGKARQRELLALARGHGLRLVGPNCLGVANTDPTVRLNAGLARGLPPAGRVGLFSQSGAIGVALLAEAAARGVGLSSFVSVGNRVDVSGNDLLQYWRDDPRTDVILLYLETFGNPRKFARIARLVGRDKPIVVVATGLSAASARAPLGGPDDQAMAALVAQSGVIRVATVSEMFDVGQLLAGRPLPAGPGVGVVGDSPAVVALALGACARAGLDTTPSPRTVAAEAAHDDLAAALGEALADEGTDAVLAVLTPSPAGGPPDGSFDESRSDESSADVSTDLSHGQLVAGRAAALRTAARVAEKPVLAVLVEGALAGLAPVPAYRTVEQAVRALAATVDYAAWRREPPGRLPVLTNVDRQRAEAAVRQGPPGATELLAGYGVDVVPQDLARSAAQAARQAASFAELGFTDGVVLKTATGGLRHRLDLGAVRLELRTATAVRRAYAELARRFGPSVLVQPMVAPGLACLIEVLDHPVLGPVVGFGIGGIATELLRDQAWRVAPLTDRDATALLRAPRAAPLLDGYGGAETVDRDALADLLIRLGRLADEQPGVKRLRLNPVLARASGLSVLHASVETGPVGPRPDTGPRRLT